MTNRMIFKILPRQDWEAAQATGRYEGAPVDLKDGFIHFSTAAQVKETARRHFRHQTDLVVVAFPSSAFKDRLRWEPSRDDDLFPHLYDALDPALSSWVEPLPLDDCGYPRVPERVRQC